MSARVKNTRIISRETDRFAYFSAFNDAILETDFQNAIRANGLISSGNQIDTTEINQYRQGIEIAQEAYRFMGTGPKIWAGNIKGCTTIQTIGQMLSFVEFENTTIFEERLRFNPVTYLETDQHENLEMIFNDGPQQNKETRIDVFTSPYLKGLDSNEALSNAHDVRGSLEDGNPLWGHLSEKNSRIEQFFDFRDHTLPPFLESGEKFYGQVLPSPFLAIENSDYAYWKFNGTKTNDKGTISLFEGGPIQYTTGPFIDKPPGFTSNLSLAPTVSFYDESTVLFGIATTQLKQINISSQALVWIPSSILDQVDYGSLESAQTQRISISSVVSQSSLYTGSAINITPYSVKWEYSVDRRGGYMSGSTFIQTTTPKFSYRDIEQKGFVSTGSGAVFDYILNEINYEISDNGIWNLDGWNHLAFARTSSVTDPSLYAHTTKLYVNGNKITSSQGRHHGYLSSSVTDVFLVGTVGLTDFSGSVTHDDMFTSGTLLTTLMPMTSFGGVRISSLKVSNTVPSDTDIANNASVLPFLNSSFADYYLSGVYSPGYLQDGYPPLPPYQDNGNLSLVTQLQTDNSQLISILHNSMSINLNDDIRIRYGLKSTSAGQDIYGPNQAQYGCDSIAFSGLLKGS